MKQLRCVGINHRTAAVEVREALACPPGEVADVLRRIVDDAASPDAEAVLVSTCNRVELYTIDCGGRGFERLCHACATTPGHFADCRYEYVGEDAVRHLFRVAASLDSMVPGETQIVGQVRRAYETARRAGTAKRRLHGLFQRAGATGRQAMAQTNLAAGRYGVAGVAASYADEIFGSLADKRLLCVGAGKMVRLVLEHFHARPPHARPHALVCVGRSEAKANDFAQSFGGVGRHIAALPEELAEADLVVCGTGSQTPIVTAAQVGDRPADRPLFLIDLAVPRDVEPGVGGRDHVHLYDLDDLQRAARRTMAGRDADLATADAIVERGVAEYVAWHRGRQVGPTIRRLYDRSHAAASREASRAAGRLPADLSPVQRAAVEAEMAELSRRLVNKLLHDPVANLRHAPDPDRHPAYKHAVEKLFGIEGADDAAK